MTSLFDPPTFNGCPPLCALTRMPAFESEAELHAWHHKRCPLAYVKQTYECPRCGKWHAVSGRKPKG